MSIDSLLQEAAAHHDGGRLDLAESSYRQVLAAAPGHRHATLELAQVLIRRGRFNEAVGLLRPLLNPASDDVAAVHRRLGLAYACGGRKRHALDHFSKALELEPDDPTILHVVANFQQSLGMQDEADATYRRALELKPLILVPAAISPPAFRVLFVFAPGAGNTPFTFLIEQACFESNVVSILKDFDYDIDRLRAHADIVVNLVSDVDQGRTILAPVEALVQRIGLPVINNPRSVLETGRDAISARLAGTPGTLVPRTRLYSPAGLQQALLQTEGEAPSFPLVIRPAGTHGGDNFEKMENEAELSAFLTRHGSQDYYLTPFVDYRSNDGYFRKYRFFYVDVEILPYHLAIDHKWKIHHVTTPMADHPWMQAEERAFLENPWSVFGVPQRETLRAIGEIVGLDYFGIDCGLNRDGDVVVFEVNASMLVHGKNERFSYKTAAVERIRSAFQAMLERAAGRARSASDPAD